MTRTHGITALGAIVIALGSSLLGAQAAAASTVSPLPRSDYGVRAVCGTPGFRRAACQAFQLVPLSAEARARRHPLGITRRTSLRAASPAEGAFGLRPQDLHSVYKLPTSASSAQTVALVDAYNDPTAESDLKAYDEEFSLPECTSANGCFKQVNQNGETANLPFPKTTKELESWKNGSSRQKKEAEEANGWGLEISLDIETAHATCQSCSILLVEATIPTYEDLEKGEHSAATLGAGEISNSWAGSEEGETPALESSSPFNHPGIVITAAAGDDGYLNWDGSEKGSVNFPASSPHVVAVGGTRLSLGVNGEWTGEAVWNGYHATGGGCSVEFTAQPWQQAVSDWASVGCSTKRAVADVAADADPYTGVAVHYTSSECEGAAHWCTIGGTSLSSPLIASVFALAGGANGVEYPAKTLYEDAVKSPGSLHDVTVGSNGECTKPFTKTGLSGCTPAEEAAKSCSSKAICLAGTGYDGPTGVGTPDGAGDFSETPATQSPPSVVTGSVSGVSQSGATLAGSVNPNGGSVSSCVIEYGTSLPSVTSVSCSPSPGGGTSAVPVSALVGGLSADTTYEYRVVATNTGGTSTGSPESFKTLVNPPTVVTGAASSLTQTSASLNATVNPNGGEVSECKLEYGAAAVYELTKSYESSVPCTSSPGSGKSPVAVSAPVAGLSANTTYHFRMVARNAGGAGYGGDETFTTLPAAPPPGPPEFGRCIKVGNGAGGYASSSCTSPGGADDYEWDPGVLQAEFTITSGSVTLATGTGSRVSCTSETGAGEYTGLKTVGDVVLALSGCEQSGEKCSSGVVAGEIVSSTLEGALGVTELGASASKDKIGLDLFGVGKAGAVLEFSCGASSVSVQGSVIVPVKANKMLSAQTLKFKAKKGKQKPAGLVGGAQDVLEASFDDAAHESIGLTLTATQSSEEAVEVNSVL